MQDVYVDEFDQIKNGERRLITNGRLEIGVFRINDVMHAFLNVCPHQGGPVCQGRVMPRVDEHLSEDRKSVGMSFSEDEFHLVCPWHGYEFKFATASHVGSSAISLRRFPTKIVGGRVYVRV